MADPHPCRLCVVGPVVGLSCVPGEVKHIINIGGGVLGKGGVYLDEVNSIL